MTPEQNHLVERLSAFLASEPNGQEASVFGGRAILVNEKMNGGVRKSAGLLVRVQARQHEGLIRSPGAGQAQMGHVRGMGGRVGSCLRPNPSTATRRWRRGSSSLWRTETRRSSLVAGRDFTVTQQRIR